jgi:hypothetical protein
MVRLPTSGPRVFTDSPYSINIREIERHIEELKELYAEPVCALSQYRGAGGKLFYYLVRQPVLKILTKLYQSRLKFTYTLQESANSLLERTLT